MADEVWKTLLRFDREIVAPDLERLLDRTDFGLRTFREDMRTGFNEMHRRFDRLDALNREISATLARIEQRQKRAK